MDAVELFRGATATWLAHLRQVSPEQWKDPTPCPEWDVHTLVNHIVGEQRWMQPLLDGATIAEVGDQFDGDLLGEEPTSVAESAAAEAMGAVPPAVATGRIAHLSFGDTPADEYVRGVAVDLLIHTWDLAAATGGERQLDPALVEAAAEWYRGNEDGYRSAGVVGPRTEGAHADPQSQLLAAFGRDPGWSRGI
jgi:uncharacterized protein (TIGR03086 family)